MEKNINVIIINKIYDKAGERLLDLLEKEVPTADDVGMIKILTDLVLGINHMVLMSSHK